MNPRKVARALFLASVLCGSLCVFPGAAMSQSAPGGAAARAAQMAAIANPFDQAALDAYLRYLPLIRTAEGTQVFVVEGDLLLTRDEVQAHLAQIGARQKGSEFSPELIVNLRNNEPDYWSDAASRLLSYAIQRDSFDSEERYKTVIEAMRLATQDWESACPECGVKFQHKSDIDAAPTHDKVTFIVRQTNSLGEYIAASFFPSNPVFKRYLNIDPSFFSTRFDRVGVLRHELGHVLGYRHEHTRDVRGCYLEDREWRPLTDYDSNSVMHYLCGGGGNIRLELTQLDRDGHRKLYGRAASSAAPRNPEGTLVVRFEKGNVAANANRAIQLMTLSGLVKGEGVGVGPKANLCALYRRALGDEQGRARCVDQDVLRISSQLTRQMAKQGAAAPVGRVVMLPANLSLRPYTFSKTYSQTAKEDAGRLKQDVRQLPGLREQGALPDGRTRAVFEGLELRATAAAASVAQAFLESLRSQGFDADGVYASWSPSERVLAPRHSIDPREHLRRCRGSYPDAGEGAYLKLLTEEPVGELLQHLAERCPAPCTGSGCVGVMLIDVPVFSNPDIRAAIAAGGLPPRAAAATPAGQSRPPLCQEADFDKDKHHGTHLAGIVASQQNGYGFIGVSPQTRLYTFDRDGMQDLEIADLIEQRMDPTSKPGRKVFLFASSLSYPPGLADGGFLKKPEDRVQRLLTATRINDIRPIWVNSAGNRKTGELGLDLRENMDQSPMNLGNLPNVIVVTACDTCGNTNARLLREANYSTKGLVHLAAPGGNIPGLADEESIAEGSGTSQAAAFVAGVAAEMLRCYADHFQSEPGSVKRRLQVTARAALDEFEADKVKAGIVDAGLALRDPRVHWLKKVGDKRKEVEVAGWCDKTMRLYRTTQNALPDGTIDARDVRRLTRNPRATSVDPLQWIIFGDNPTGIANDVRRVGPGMFATVRDDAPVLKLANTPDGADPYVRLGQIEDLTLATSRLPVVSCSPQ